MDLRVMQNLELEVSDARRVQFVENTSYYIEHYLKPSRKWNREVSAKRRIDLVRYTDVNWAAISDHIKGMNYRDFLATPYWKAIAAHAKYKAGYRCQLCNSHLSLSTHHRNYAIHGKEHDHINELIVLCNHCHQKFHGKQETLIQPRINRSAFDLGTESPSDNAFRVTVLVSLALFLIGYLFVQSSY